MPCFSDSSLIITLPAFCLSSYLFALYIRRNNKNIRIFENALQLRKRHFSDNVTLSYSNSNPLMIVEGRGTYLHSSTGQRYLDTRNNVAHCGHCHPVITSRIQTQVAKLNTNTRYLHPYSSLVAEKLTSLFPPPLDKVFFVNSGSEANDLALRLARCWNSDGKVIVVEGGYHGHTLATLGVSPYKFDTSKERLKHENVVKVPFPDTFRKKPNDAARHYAQFVQNICKTECISAMIVESGMSVAGVILPPPNYLPLCAKAVRNAGGLFVIDEVQTGFGRLGSCFWAFQYHDSDFVPDIVTVGKPFGNGMPLAAVITSKEVVEKFVSVGVEYFNTFGGNTVSCAAGLAVLDVIQKEGLQQNALKVGEYLIQRLKNLQKRYDIIGDVRGSGLFIGIEFVQNDLKPASVETSFLCSVLKEKYCILTSVDGFHDNVMVVKPPMCFDRENVDEFVRGLKGALEDLKGMGNEELKKIGCTPT